MRLIQLLLIQVMAFLTWCNVSGFNVAHRRRKTGVVGFQHRLTKEDAMKWFQQKVCLKHSIIVGESLYV